MWQLRNIRSTGLVHERRLLSVLPSLALRIFSTRQTSRKLLFQCNAEAVRPGEICSGHDLSHYCKLLQKKSRPGLGRLASFMIEWAFMVYVMRLVFPQW